MHAHDNTGITVNEMLHEMPCRANSRSFLKLAKKERTNLQPDRALDHKQECMK